MKKRRSNSANRLVHSLSIPYYVVLVLLIVIPILIMVLYSFQKDGGTGSSFFSFTFTLENYGDFFKEASYLKTMWKSIYLALISTVITLIIGYPVAYMISRLTPRNQVLAMTLITAPLWINMLLRVLALKQIFEMTIPSLLGSSFAVIVGMVYLFLPFMVIPIYTVLQKIDYLLIEAALDLGASRFQVFLKVILPLSIPGVLSGIMMVILPAATSLVIPKYLGNGMFLIGNLVEKETLSSGRFGHGSAVAMILSVIMLLIVFVIRKATQNKEGTQND